MGAPTKFDKRKKDEYLALLRAGGRRQTSARSVGVHPSTIAAHANADPDFAAAISEAEMEAHETVESALFQQATGGNMTAIQVYLYNRYPEKWADRRTTRVTGAEGGPVQVSYDPQELEAKVQKVLAQRAKK